MAEHLSSANVSIGEVFFRAVLSFPDGRDLDAREKEFEAIRMGGRPGRHDWLGRKLVPPR